MSLVCSGNHHCWRGTPPNINEQGFINPGSALPGTARLGDPFWLIRGARLDSSTAHSPWTWGPMADQTRADRSQWAANGIHFQVLEHWHGAIQKLNAAVVGDVDAGNASDAARTSDSSGS